MLTDFPNVLADFSDMPVDFPHPLTDFPRVLMNFPSRKPTGGRKRFERTLCLSVGVFGKNIRT